MVKPENGCSDNIRTVPLYRQKTMKNGGDEIPKIPYGQRFPEYGTAYKIPITNACSVHGNKRLYQKTVVYGSGFVLNLLGSRGWCNYLFLPINDPAARRGRHQIYYRGQDNQLKTIQYISVSAAIQKIQEIVGYAPGLIELTSNHTGLLVVISIEGC